MCAELKFQVLSCLLAAAAEGRVRIGMPLSFYLTKSAGLEVLNP